MLFREADQETMAHAALLELAAVYCLEHGHDVIVEGILNAQRYAAMLERISSHAEKALF